MPTFCRHNRFVERCPICSKTLPGASAPAGTPARPRTGSARQPSRQRRGGARAEQAMHVRREARAADDGYRSTLVPGLRASADAERLAAELAFANGRLIALAADPPGLYAELRELAPRDPGRATWGLFLTAYLAPTEDEDPFAGIRGLLALGPPEGAPAPAHLESEPFARALGEVPLGPRSSHDPARGAGTLLAYLEWARRGDANGPGSAFAGDPGWSAERRFERLFERLALPGLTRPARYELLVTLGRLGLFELRADALHLAAQGIDDGATSAAKRVFGIADTQLLERRAKLLAEEAGTPLEALDLALANWGAAERSSAGFPGRDGDEQTLARASAALEL